MDQINGHEEPTLEESQAAAVELLKASKVARVLALSFGLIDPEARTLKDVMNASGLGTPSEKAEALFLLADAGIVERVYRIAPAGRDRLDELFGDAAENEGVS